MNLENVKLSKKKSARTDHMLYDTICMKCPEEAKSLTEKLMSGCLGLSGGIWSG